MSTTTELQERHRDIDPDLDVQAIFAEILDLVRGSIA